MADHFSRMLALRAGREDRIWSVDEVHRKYLTAAGGSGHAGGRAKPDAR